MQPFDVSGDEEVELACRSRVYEARARLPLRGPHLALHRCLPLAGDGPRITQVVLERRRLLGADPLVPPVSGPRNRIPDSVEIPSPAQHDARRASRSHGRDLL